MKNFRKIRNQGLPIFVGIFLCGMILVSPFTSSASEETSMDVIGRLYEFGEKSEYEISSTQVHKMTTETSTLGTCSVSGTISRTFEKDDIPAYEVADNEFIAFSYVYDGSLLDDSDDAWHLTEDNKKIVDGIDLPDKIKHGALIFQTSLDRETWITSQIYTDLVPSQGKEPYEKKFLTNEIQLTNGCYYRMIVAYKMKFETGTAKYVLFDKPVYEYKKIAEVYEFYAGYRNAGIEQLSANERKYSLGALVNAGKGNGYSGTAPVDGEDLHYGWELGNFFVSGYTEKTDDQIFLKNVGDRITLWFNLKQDITSLNGDTRLRIIEDKNGYDQEFQTPKMNFGYGTLIIRYTDYQGVKHDPVIYENYLKALTSEGANVRVKFFEEGDYEVALDYKIKNTKGLGKTSDYRISFQFKVRNGNCMVYPFDIKNRSELTDSSVTEHGFYLDLARSRYLKINVTRAVWTRGTGGYTEDIRYNRPARDGEEYTDEGIYTIEVSNPSTGKTTEKKIYVGTDNILKAFMKADNGGYSINEIAELVDKGADIQQDGTIILPAKGTVEGIQERSVMDADEIAEVISPGSTVEGGHQPLETVLLVPEEIEGDYSGLFFAILGTVSGCGAGILIYGLWKKKRSSFDLKKGTGK